MKASKLHSGNYRVLISKGSGESRRRISFTAPTKREAIQKAQEYIVEHHMDDSPMTIEKAVYQYIESREDVLSPTTIRGYRQMVKYIEPIKDEKTDYRP